MSHFRIIRITYLLLLGVLAVATIIEAATGTSNVYGTWWFDALWAVFALGVVCAMPRMWGRWSMLLLHGSIFVILCGAGLTHFTGREGTLHLRAGIPMVVDDGLTVRLDSFEVKCYPGTPTPADYVSHLTVGDVSMNRPLTVQDYRLYQMGYDTDCQGATLSWRRDPWGETVTYTGYGMLVLSLLWWLLPGVLPRRWTVLLLVLQMTSVVNATPAISRDKADSLERVQVVWNGRVAPMGTVAHEFMLKVHGRTTYRGLTAMQVMGSWVLRPDEWWEEPLLKIRSRWLRRQLSAEEYVAPSMLFENDGSYRLAPLYAEVQATPKAAKAVRELDEQVGLVLMLTQGTLVENLKEGAPQLSPMRVEAELVYNRVPATMMLCVACFVLAVLHSLGMRLYRGSCLLFLLQLAHYAMRWYVAGRIPLSNGYETMQFMAMAVLGIGMLTHRTSASLLVAACTLLVAHLGEMSPQITPLVPVLNSPWLSSHVSCIMTAYALAALMAVESGIGLIRGNAEGLQLGKLRLTVALMAIGIVLGAVWAGESWGAYWTWDPKEVWALITLMVYAMPLHPHLLPLKSVTARNWYMLLAFASVLMTYFGVNYVLGGMHSYA